MAKGKGKGRGKSSKGEDTVQIVENLDLFESEQLVVGHDNK